MKIVLGLILALALVGCDEVVSQTPYPDQAYIRKGTQTCEAGAGYCCELGFGFNGKYEYSCGLKLSCDGQQPVTERVVPVVIKYESGKVTKSAQTYTVSVDGPCER